MLTLAQLQALVALLIVTGKATEADLAPWRLLVSFVPWWEVETGRSAWPLPAVEVVRDMVARLPGLATDEAVAQAAAELGQLRGSEQQQDDHQDDHQFRCAHAEH